MKTNSTWTVAWTRVLWDDLPRDVTVRQVADTASAMGIKMQVCLTPLFPCPFLADAWRRLAARERGGPEAEIVYKERWTP